MMATLDEMDRRARAEALADVYIATQQIQDLLETRLVAIQQALAFGATLAEVAQVMDDRQALWP